jgi:hypothetical protein
VSKVDPADQPLSLLEKSWVLTGGADGMTVRATTVVRQQWLEVFERRMAAVVIVRDGDARSTTWAGAMFGDKLGFPLAGADPSSVRAWYDHDRAAYIGGASKREGPSQPSVNSSAR